MLYIKEMVEIVNSILRATSLREKKYQSGRYESLAVEVTRKTTGESGNTVMETFPAVVNSTTGEQTAVSPDDTYPITIYSKISGCSFVKQEKQYGNGDKNIIQRADMKMVVFGKRSALQMSAEELAAQIYAGFPDSVSSNYYAGVNIDSMHVFVTQMNMVQSAVFSEEFRGRELFISADDIYFSIRYTIESRHRKNCFATLEC